MTRLIKIKDQLFTKENFGWFGGLIIDGTTYNFDTVEELLTFIENEDCNLNNFDKINKELGLKKVGTYRRFRCHMLRKFHASALYNANNGLSLDEIDSLQGRSKDKTHSSYFMENPNLLKEKYINSLDAITIN